LFYDLYMYSHNNAFDCSRNDWPPILFVKHPELFLPILENMKDQAQFEVEGLHVIPQKFSTHVIS
jgi:hypothetical protein